MSEPDSPICRRILLVRHGHYERTAGLGDAVWGLSAHGRRQAVRVGRRLSRLMIASSSRFEGAYSSPWPRASQTAEIAAREMDLASVKIKSYLHEVIPVVDPRREEFSLFPMGALEATSNEDRSTAATQIERVRGRFFKPPRRSSLLVLFTHGNLIRYLVTSTLGLPFESWARMDVAHTGITELRVYSNGFHALICFNETGHLPPPMITTS